MVKLKYIIKQIIQEKWYDTVKRGQSDVEIFVNPNPPEIRDAIKNTGFKIENWTKIRGFINLKTDDIYIWKPSKILHEWMLKFLPFSKNSGLEFNYMPRNKEVYVSDSFNQHLNFKEIDWYFYKDLLKKTFDVNRVRLGEHIKDALGLGPGDKF